MEFKIEFNDKWNQIIKKTPALYQAVDKENVEIVKLLISNVKIDINLPYILEI